MSSTINININYPLKGKAIIVFNNNYIVIPFQNGLTYQRPISNWSTENVVLFSKDNGLVDFEVTNIFGSSINSAITLPSSKKNISLNFINIDFSNTFFGDQDSWVLLLNQLFVDYRSNYVVNSNSIPIDYAIDIEIGNSDSYYNNTITLLQNSILNSPLTLMHELIHALKSLLNSEDNVDPHLDAGNVLALMHNNAGLYIDYYTLLNIHGLKSLSEDYRDTLQYYYFPETGYDIASVQEYIEYLDCLGLDLRLVFVQINSEKELKSIMKNIDHAKMIRFISKYWNDKELRKNIEKKLTKLIYLKTKFEFDYINKIHGISINEKINSSKKYKKIHAEKTKSTLETNIVLYQNFFLQEYSNDKRIVKMLKK